jgi:hypothetical protein
MKKSDCSDETFMPWSDVFLLFLDMGHLVASFGLHSEQRGQLQL